MHCYYNPSLISRLLVRGPNSDPTQVDFSIYPRISALVFHGILFILLIAMFFYTKWSNRINITRLLYVFVRDGAWAFTVVFGEIPFFL